jgi:hypothetical protein
MQTDPHTSRDEYGPTRLRPRVELSASALALSNYQPSLIVRILRRLGVQVSSR